MSLQESPLLKKGVSLEKSRVNLEKVAESLNIGEAPTQVIGNVDTSGSIGRFYPRILSALVTSVCAVGLKFDDNGVIPMFGFSNSATRLKDLTAANLDGYVKKYIKEPIGGTEYSKAVEKILGFIEVGDPVNVITFTDGDNQEGDNNSRFKQLIAESSSLPIYWQFVGLHDGRDIPDFSLLEDLSRNSKGRKTQNVGFMVGDLNHLQEEDIFRDLLTGYMAFRAEARAKNMLDANMKWAVKNPFNPDSPLPSLPSDPPQRSGFRDRLRGIFG